jgi:hypothetical protein
MTGGDHRNHAHGGVAAGGAPVHSLRRQVGLGGAVMMGLGSILGTGVFVSVGIGAGIAGPAVVLAIGLAGVLAVCNALSSAQLAASHPVSGGTYEYGYRYLTPWLGFSAGWMFLCAKSASAATAALGFAGYALHAAGVGGRVSRTALALAAVVGLTGLVLAGVRRSNRANMVIVGVTLATLVFFVLAGLRVRLSRSIVTMITVVLAIAFLTYTGLSGKLTLQCIVWFIRRFPCIAAEMIFQYSHHGRKGTTISFPALCGQVTRLVLGLLHLLPPSDGQPLSIAAFAQAPYWRLLDDPHAVEEVFCMALSLVDFLHFHEALPMEAVEPHTLEMKRQVSWALAQGPVTVQSLWELWLAVRAELRRRYREVHRGEEEAEEEEGRRRRKGGRQEEDAEVDLACFLEADPKDDQVVYKVSKGVRSRMLGKSAIMAPWQVITLERSLPEEHQDRDWLLLYSLKKHGAAMHSIFERCKSHRYSLLCLSDSDGVVFGGMASEEWKDRKDRYFGSGESFLFSFKGDKFVKYTWTRSNSYFMLASHGIGLAMGGGQNFGLFVSPDLMHGSSDHCETFGSAALSRKKTFDVVNIEVWGFGAPAGMDLGRETDRKSVV